jgi:hypothetical protein
LAVIDCSSTSPAISGNVKASWTTFCF